MMAPMQTLARAGQNLLADSPEWFRWLFGWVALIAAMTVACWLLIVVLAAALGLT
jgi:hypothetical protein